MRDFHSSTLLRVSTFNAALENPADDTLPGGLAASLRSGTLLAGLRRLQANPRDDCLLAALSVCVRQREAVLLLLEHGDWVWPVTVFPAKALYHSVRDVTELAEMAALSRLKLIGAVQPEVREPGFNLTPDAERLAGFRPLSALLVNLALHGPRTTLLAEINGRAAYRRAPGRSTDLPALPGALAPVVERLGQKAASLKDIANWPGMSLDRACRLLNALYLSGGLMVTRSHPAARQAPRRWADLLGRWR